MVNKMEYYNKCFAPNWIEIDLEELESTVNKEERLENQRRKDLNTLLKELQEIKQSIERAAEKQHRLTNLMGLYTGRLVQ